MLQGPAQHHFCLVATKLNYDYLLSRQLKELEKQEEFPAPLR